MLNTDRLCFYCMNDNGGETVCPLCGHSAQEQNPSAALPVKFWLNDRYLVGRVLAADGEGLTYIAWDNAADCAVSVREYFPDGIAFRNPDRTVSMSPDKKYAFNEGLLDFLTLNRKLLSPDFPALPKTEAVFEENGTAYTVRHIPTGKRFPAFLQQNGNRLKWEQARSLFLPLIDTLAALHEAGIICGDISPENIIVGANGSLIIDRLSISQINRTGSEFSARLCPGYAAPEQYDAQQLPTAASDVYGLSALLFRTLIGIAPPAANERLQKETLSVPAHFAEELPRQVLIALANGLQLSLEKRTKTIDTFRNELVYGETVQAARPAAARRADDAAPNRPAKKEKQPKKGGNKTVITILISAGITAVVCLLLVFVLRSKLGLPGCKSTDKKETASTESASSEIDVPEDAAEISVPDVADGKRHFSQVDAIPECQAFHIDYQYETSSYPAGVIIDQSPKAGATAKEGSALHLVVSIGPKEVTVPNLIGKTEREAWRALMNAGLTNVEVMEINKDSNKAGKVVGQSITAGTAIAPSAPFQFDVQIKIDPPPQTEPSTDIPGTTDPGYYDPENGETDNTY